MAPISGLAHPLPASPIKGEVLPGGPGGTVPRIFAAALVPSCPLREAVRRMGGKWHKEQGLGRQHDPAAMLAIKQTAPGMIRGPLKT